MCPIFIQNILPEDFLILFHNSFSSIYRLYQISLEGVDAINHLRGCIVVTHVLITLYIARVVYRLLRSEHLFFHCQILYKIIIFLVFCLFQ